MVSMWKCAYQDSWPNCSLAKNKCDYRTCRWQRETLSACEEAIKYWSFAAGFFLFHCLCAMFDRDEERLNDAQRNLSTACSRLGLPVAFHERISANEKKPSWPVDARSFRDTLAQTLRQTFGESARWRVECGYLSALAFASLLAQAKSNVPQDALANVQAIADMLPTIITAVNHAELPDHFTEALFSVKKQLAESKDKSSAAKCRDILAPSITNLLLTDSPSSIMQSGDNHPDAMFS